MIARLGDIAEFINGGAWSDKEYTESGIAVVKVTNLKNGTVNLKEVNYIPESSLDKYGRHLLQKGDLVVATVGSHPNLVASAAGRATIIPADAEGALLNQNALCIRTNSENLNQSYLGYLGKSELFQGYVKSVGRGAANQVRIALGLIKEFSFNLPALPTQRKIASILSAYDDLIENNLKRITLLEEKAFLRYRLLDKSAKYKLSDMYVTSSGGTPSRTNAEYFTGDINWFKSKELADSILLDSEEKITEGAVEKSSAKLFPVGSVIMAMYGATIGMLGFLTQPSTTNQACCAIIQKDTIKSNYYILNWLLENKEYVLSFRMGAAQENISQMVIKNLIVSIPNDKDLLEFNKEAQPIYQLIKNLQIQNTKLREARDILLPKLINAQIIL